MDSQASKPHLGVARIVMPMFGFVLAYNLARPGAVAKGVHGRMLCRLTLAGLTASPMSIILNGMYVTTNAWWPLNILFMLLLVVLLGVTVPMEEKHLLEQSCNSST